MNTTVKLGNNTLTRLNELLFVMEKDGTVYGFSSSGAVYVYSFESFSWARRTDDMFQYVDARPSA